MTNISGRAAECAAGSAPRRYRHGMDARNGSTPPATQMAPADAFFWHAEQASPELRPLVAGLFMLDRCPDHPRLRRALRRLIALAPRLRQRVVDPPLGIGLPSWVSDASFDLDYHLRIVSLGEGAGAPAMLAHAAELFSAPLDPMRPLWEAHLFEECDGGRAALFLKLHHSLLDGAGSIVLFDGLTQARRDDPIRVPRRAGARDAAVRQPATLASAVRDLAGLLTGLANPVQVGRLVRSVAGMLADVGRASESAAWHGGGSGVARRLATLVVELARLRHIGRRLDATLNDVVLTAVAGALGAYEELGRRGPRELQCMVPMSLRNHEDRQALGNRVGGFTVSLPIREPNATARLARIQAQTRRAKSDGHAAAFKAMMQAAAYVPPVLFRAAGQLVSGKLHLLCSNVPGPPTPRYLAGARIESVHPFAPVMRGTPLSIALMSYAGQVGFGIDSDPVELPDPERIAMLLQREFAALDRVAARRAGIATRASAV
jgi:WS/DGAT/MGAT family acyltransferase